MSHAPHPSSQARQPATTPDRRRRSLLKLGSLSLLGAAGGLPMAHAGNTATLVVPFPAGGSTDVAARAIAAAMGQEMGWTFAIENIAGNDGLDAGMRVTNARPDDVALFFGTATAMSYAPATRKNMPFDPLTGFTPLGQAVEIGFFLYVAADLAVRSVAELIATIQSHPGDVKHGYATGSGRLDAALFAQAHGLKIEQVAYRGDADLAPDLAAGKVQMAFASGALIPQVRQGKIRALATPLPARSPLLPEVPTLDESGLKPIAIKTWGGLFAPPALPRDTTDALAQALRRALANPDVQRRLDDLAIMPRASTGEALSMLMRDQLVLWKQAAEMVGLAAK